MKDDRPPPAMLNSARAVPRREAPERAPLDAGIYLVGTPIGNLEDITLRALRVLEGADRIACEDTRQTQKLLNHFGISTPTVSFHQHNEQARIAELLEPVLRGGTIAVVSDAGMPGISDPGLPLVRAAIDAGVRVIPIPGANAALTALIASGLDTRRFLYCGFLPSQSGARQAALESLAVRHTATLQEEPLTLIFYEAPHRVIDTLMDVESVWGAPVRVVVARELTKLHEEILRGSAAEVRSALAARERVRGEIVLLVEARRTLAVPVGRSVAQRVTELAEGEGLGEKEALKRIARERGISKSDAYRELQRERSKK